MKASKEDKTLFTNTVMLYIMQISGYLFPLLTFPYLTRVLGSDTYGILTASSAVMSYFQLLVDFGFILSATRDCSLCRDDKKQLIRINCSVVQAKCLLSLIGLIVLLPVIGVVPLYRENALYLILSYLSVFLSSFIPDYLFRGLEKMSSITYRTLGARTIYLILVFAFIHTERQFILVPVFNAASNLFIVAWSWWYVLKKFRLPYRFQSLTSTLETLKRSAIFFLSRIASTLYGASNVFLMTLLGFPTGVLGQYGAADSLIQNARKMLTPISDSLYPYMVKNRNFKLLKRLLLIFMPVIVAGCVFLYVFAELFIRILCGEGYEQAIPVFRGFLPMLAITLPIYLLGFPTLSPMGMDKEANLTTIYASIFHFVGLTILVLTGKISVTAIIILTTCSECIVLFSRIVYVIIGSRRMKRAGQENQPSKESAS